ncbi:MAG TPA: NAD(P)H-binding protein [Gemmatimonadaceae bacterium]|nr:NAD(P)H-binding protein [Gemmatimonadaceae bacterium]
MTNVIILGATGSLARVATTLFLNERDVRLTLYVRKPRLLGEIDAAHVRVIEGDVLDTAKLTVAITGQDVVYANLAGDLVSMAESVVRAMHAAGVRRLVWISSMGIYSEVPGERYGRVLDPYRDSAAVIEASDLDWTILRPGWFNDDDEISYETTRKGEAFRGHDISRRSLASLVVKLATTPGLEVHQSLGVNTPV